MLSKLEPSFSPKIWGGSKLSKIKNYEPIDLPLGETWEISTHLDGPSSIKNKSLDQLCHLSYLVKFIDTADNLSIQVHPNNEYAKLHENSSGKTECWIILTAEKDSGIYLGFKPGVTKESFKETISNSVDVQNKLNFIPVAVGDFFYVPSGSIHAIGSGITLCEIQQNSGVTYRVWDWNRTDSTGRSRELHLDKALDVINFNREFNLKLREKKKIFEYLTPKRIVNHDDFKVDFIFLEKNETKKINLKEKGSLVLLSGNLSINDEQFYDFDCGITLAEGPVYIVSNKKSRFLLIEK